MPGRFWRIVLGIWGGVAVLGCPPLLAQAPPVPGAALHAAGMPGSAHAAASAPVRSFVPPMADINDIKPLVAVPVPGDIPRGVWYALLGVLGAALLGAGGFYLWKKKRRGGRTAVPPPPPPEAVAREALDALGVDSHIGDKLFYFRLSAILRAYLDGRFGLEAMEMTTEELVPLLDRLAMERTLKSGVREFLAFSDPVKFADASPAHGRRERDIDFVLELVEKTTAAVAPGDGG